MLKRYVNRDWLEREPDLAAREATALRIMANSAVAVPEVIAVDPDGSACGAPSLLMTRLVGSHRWVPPSIEQFAEVAIAVHDVVPPPHMRRYRRYVPPGAEPPPWTTQRRLWERALVVADAADPAASSTGFIHRDHHAGNVLWWRGRVSGVVDMVEACVGPLAVDAARARLNLAWEIDLDAARRYARCPDVAVDPVWDVVDAIDCCIGIGGKGETIRKAHDAFLAEALSQLG